MIGSIISHSTPIAIPINRSIVSSDHHRTPNSSFSCIKPFKPQTLIIRSSRTFPLLNSQLSLSSHSSGTLTLEKSKLDLSITSPVKHEIEADTGGGDNGDNSGSGRGGGGGGDVGGGGGGDRGDGDDDEYHYRDFDPEGGDGEYFEALRLFQRRQILPEIFNKKIVDAVLSEWMKTIKDLPLGLQSAYEFGIMSSAEITRFISFSALPSLSRFLSRSLPQYLNGVFNGKIVADPALPAKVMVETVASACCSIFLDYTKRGSEDFKKEWDVAVKNALMFSTCNGFVVWLLAPCYSYGCPPTWFNWQTKLPNNVFERSYRFKTFSLQERVASFCCKAVGLSVIGSAARATQLALNNGRKSSDTIALPMSSLLSAATASTLYHGVYMGLHTNLRYQMLCGFDRVMVDYFDVMGVATFFNLSARIWNVWGGANEAYCLSQSEESKQNMLLFPLEAAATNWFSIKNAVTSGFGLLVDPSKQADINANGTTKARRRRRVDRNKLASVLS